jgi:hypothetical protein
MMEGATDESTDFWYTKLHTRRAVASMGVIDTATNKYIRQNHVFADAFNFLIYNGKQVIDPDSLQELDSKALDIVYGGTDVTNQTVQRYRDVMKTAVLMTDQKMTYLILAVENQSEIHYAMPVKNCMYDAMQYAWQVQQAADAHQRNGTNKGITGSEYLSRFHKTDKLLPVVTLVIYFGDKKWDGPMSLHEMFDRQDETILSLVPDYKLNLIAPANIADGEYGLFQSDLKEVLSFIKYAKDKQKLQELLVTNSSFQTIGKDAVDVINACTGAKLKQEERKVVDVCQAIQEIAEEAAEKAREEVRAQMRDEMEKAMATAEARAAEARVAEARAAEARAVEAKVVAEAMKEKNSMLLKSIKALMEKAGLTLEQSMSALDLSESDRKNLSPLM